MFGLIPFRMSRGINNINSSLSYIFDTFFNDEFTNAFSMEDSIKADVRETDEAYLVQAELPGINKEDVRLDYENNYLTISALRKDIFEDKCDNYLRQERYYGEISRRFYFDNVEKDQIQARFQNGVLDILLPKKEANKNNYSRINIQ